MKCDKCGGLVVMVESDELKCCLCSKRFWKTDGELKMNGIETLRKAVTEMANESVGVIPRTIQTNGHAFGKRRCSVILKNGTTQCKTEALKDYDVCFRHRRPQDRKDLMTIKAVEPEEPVIISRAHPIPPNYPDLMLPEELRFVVSREQKDWNRFAMVWSLKFVEYEMDTITNDKDDDNKVDVWLRLKKNEQA